MSVERWSVWQRIWILIGGSTSQFLLEFSDIASDNDVTDHARAISGNDYIGDIFSLLLCFWITQNCSACWRLKVDDM